MKQANIPGVPNPPSISGEAGKALFRLGRFFSRQSLPQRLVGQTESGVELSQILAVQAVEAGLEAGEQVTVGTVAQRLGLDPSTASRVVADAVRDGFLARAASQADGRRSLLELTQSGRALAADASDYQRSVFEAVTATWTEKERQTFARLFIKFADGVADVYKRRNDTDIKVLKSTDAPRKL